MKKLIYLLIFIFPVSVFAQQPWLHYSPMGADWKFVGNADFSAGVAYDISLEFNPWDSLPYVAYQDRTLYENVTVMKFNGTRWVNVGDAGFSTDFPEYVRLAFRPSNGFPYVAYSDIGGNKAKVMMFNGTSWVHVGNAGQGFSAGEADHISLAFSPSDDHPYVAYEDYGHSHKATVMTFNGTHWVNVGNAGFSAGATDNECLAFNPYDYEPYVAYMDWVKSGVSVMKFNGSNWEYVGTAGFSTADADEISLAFNPLNGLPYVAFSDWSNALKVSVMMFDGTGWAYVGNPGFSSSLTQYENLAFSPVDGAPCVVYADSAGLATVLRFNGTNWAPVGKKGFSPGVVYFPCLGFSPADKQAYVAFEDAVTGFASVMKYDSVVGVNELIQSKLSLYPNPAAEKIIIDTPSKGNLIILNLNGMELMKRQIIAPKTQLDITLLPAGVYFVRVTGNNTVHVGKFVKQ